jgi:hypothetical protein
VRIVFSLTVAIAITASFAARAQLVLVPNGNFEQGFVSDQSGTGQFLDWTSSGNAPSQANLTPSQNYQDASGQTWAVQYGTFPGPPPGGGFNVPVAIPSPVTSAVHSPMGTGPVAAGISTSGTSSSYGWLSQGNFAITAGDTYYISFDLIENNYNSTADANIGFALSFAGQTLANINSSENSATLDNLIGPTGNNGTTWSPFITSFTATTTESDAVLGFGFLNDQGTWGFDDVEFGTSLSAGQTVNLSNPATSSPSIPDSGVGFGLIAATLLGLCGLSFHNNRRLSLAPAVCRR